MSALINTLRKEELLPKHQANMMLTLSNLRNVYVYDQVEMGHNEVSVASAAWNIVSEWWEDNAMD